VSPIDNLLSSRLRVLVTQHPKRHIFKKQPQVVPLAQINFCLFASTTLITQLVLSDLA
jgi:hypothetical protein